MRRFSLIIILIFIGFAGCSSEGELTEEKVRTSVVKCLQYQHRLDYPSSGKLEIGIPIEIDPIFIENNRATVGFTIKYRKSIRGKARFMKDSRGDWYLEKLQTPGYSSNYCSQIIPLLVE